MFKCRAQRPAPSGTPGGRQTSRSSLRSGRRRPSCCSSASS